MTGVLIAEAKVGILAASMLAGALGWIILRLSPSVDEGTTADVEDEETDAVSGH